MKPRRRLLKALVAALAAALLLGLVACSQAVSGRAELIAFRDCTAGLEQLKLPIPADLKGKLRFDCGQLVVPLDYARPDGRQVELFVVRIHDVDNTHPVGSLLTNPGGPGASGLNFALGFLGKLPKQVIEKFDVIGFDPRGVGLSSPIRCVSDAQKDRLVAEAPDVTTPAGFARARATAKSFADACEKKYGSALQYYNTVNTARDMDRIRRGVGDERMNYLGFSYGTELGWVYAHQYPSTTRAVVLDGAVDPDTSDLDQSANQIQGFERAFDQFAAHCRTVSPCKQLGDPRQAVEQIFTTAAHQPLSTKSTRRLTVGLAYSGVLQALYAQSLWNQLAKGLISARAGDGTGLLALADRYNERGENGRYTNILDANTTISCNDSKPQHPSDATIRQIAQQWAVKYPLFGRGAASSLFACQDWQPHRTPIPSPRAATRSKVLVVGNLHDPATPYQGARDLTRDLGNAELLTWDGQGHTSYRQGSPCVDRYVNTYLLTLKVPPDNTTCPAR